MKFDVKYTSRFKKDYKRLKKRGYDMGKLLDVIDLRPAQERIVMCFEFQLV